MHRLYLNGSGELTASSSYVNWPSNGVTCVCRMAPVRFTWLPAAALQGRIYTLSLIFDTISMVLLDMDTGVHLFDFLGSTAVLNSAKLFPGSDVPLSTCKYQGAWNQTGGGFRFEVSCSFFLSFSCSEKEVVFL